MNEISQEEGHPVEARLDEPSCATPYDPDNAARPRCLFCRYRVPAATEERSHA